MWYYIYILNPLPIIDPCSKPSVYMHVCASHADFVEMQCQTFPVVFCIPFHTQSLSFWYFQEALASPTTWASSSVTRCLLTHVYLSFCPHPVCSCWLVRCQQSSSSTSICLPRPRTVRGSEYDTSPDPGRKTAVVFDSGVRGSIQRPPQSTWKKIRVNRTEDKLKFHNFNFFFKTNLWGENYIDKNL